MLDSWLRWQDHVHVIQDMKKEYTQLPLLASFFLCSNFKSFLWIIFHVQIHFYVEMKSFSNMKQKKKVKIVKINSYALQIVETMLTCFLKCILMVILAIIICVLQNCNTFPLWMLVFLLMFLLRSNPICNIFCSKSYLGIMVVDSY